MIHSDKVDIFTLNHDILVEDYLTNNKVKYCDGFGHPIKDVRYWEYGRLDSSKESTRVIKLHGALNWFDFPDLSTPTWKTGIPLNSDYHHTLSASGEMQMPYDGRPNFLAGVGNKPLEYHLGIYVELHHYFYRWLRENQKLVVIGYGFGDLAINQRISEWLLHQQSAQLIVVHPEPDLLKNNPIISYWEKPNGTGKVQFIKKAAEDLRWPALRQMLFP